MKIEFVIKEMPNGGYFKFNPKEGISGSDSVTHFKYATRYEKYEEAERIIEMIPSGSYSIIKVYVK